MTPYSYYVQIADNTIDVSLAVSHQSAIYDFEFSYNKGRYNIGLPSSMLFSRRSRARQVPV